MPLDLGFIQRQQLASKDKVRFVGVRGGRDLGAGREEGLSPQPSAPGSPHTFACFLSLYGSVDGCFARAVLQGQSGTLCLASSAVSDCWSTAFIYSQKAKSCNKSVRQNVSDCSGVLLILMWGVEIGGCHISKQKLHRVCTSVSGLHSVCTSVSVYRVCAPQYRVCIVCAPQYQEALYLISLLELLLIDLPLWKAARPSVVS